MSDLLRALPKIKQNNPPGLRPPPRPLTTADEDGSSDSSASSASTNDSIDTLRPSSREENSLPQNPWTRYFSQELYLDHQTPDYHATYHVYLTPPTDRNKGPLFICHHGAGASGMSFARFATSVKAVMPSAGILSLEARDHGSVITSPSGESLPPDFSIATLAADALAMITLTTQQMGWPKVPPSVFVGHSLGGAVCTHVAAEGSLGAQLVGFAVLDVVEGSAIEALQHMSTYLASRPPSFASVDAAVEWHVRSRTIRDLESARASVPSLLIRERETERWRWKTDLWATKAWWEGWFMGMSKFQLQVIPEAGHFIQEDVPEKTAQLMTEFFKRNDRSSLVLPPKVSELLAQGKKV
ncbi:Protein phosphatase methylesterase 1 [Taxawa tesnikishii (nom. ined.)]|nr:Protein phosphatase methylesterase 1 [Dothideales sp. JES 119]